MKRTLLLLAVALIATNTLCSAQGGLNEIRFRGWTDEDWLDNDYLRELRSHLDAYVRGEVYAPALAEYEDVIDSKFVVASIEPAIMGGVYVLVVFLDDPAKVFHSHIYSYVDEDEEVVTGYKVRWFDRCEGVDDFPFSRDEIIELALEHPFKKVLW